jgi:murein DD-endopeptidase MepM/ murein hydrolase activator NlpD
MARGRTPGPLDNLPRPLSEREGRHGRRLLRRLATLGILGALVIGAFVGASTLIPAAMVPAGAVEGIVATPGTSPSPASIPLASGGADRFARSMARAPHPMDSEAGLIRAGDRRPPVPESLTGYRWPLAVVRITLPFGPSPWGSRLVEGGSFHDGIDIATFCGDRVVAAHDGTVLAAGRHYDAYMGWVGDLTPYLARLDAKHLWDTLPIVVVVDDGNEYRSIYAHFERVVVHPGEFVTAGTLLGYEGRTGRATGCHVHYGLFSPQETAVFAMEPAVIKRMKIPRYQIARIDPMRVMPPP